MKGTRHVVWIALALALLLAAASSAEDYPVLGTQSFTRDFGGRTVSCDITARAGGVLEAGQRIIVQIDLNSSISGGAPDELASAVVINGLVAVALPPGLEPDGQLRLYYYDESRGSYQFMYSKDLPPLDRLAGLSGALEQAQGKDPKTIYGGLSEISRALDPSVEPRGPTDSRVIGGNAAYAVSGVSWLIPCNVYFKAVVNPFALEDSLSREARVRVNVPLKATSALAQPRIVVYAGGLSTAAVQTELPADAIPPTALPLAPLPEPAPAAAAPAAQDGGASAAPQRDTGSRPSGRAGNGRSDTDGRGALGRHSEGADEEPQPPAPPEQPGAQGAAPAPPPRIPVLIYSYAWVAWETELDLSSLAPAQAPPSPGPRVAPGGAAAPVVAPGGGEGAGAPGGNAPPVQVEPPAAAAAAAGSTGARPSGRQLPPPQAKPEDETPPPAETAAAAAPSSGNAPPEEQDSSQVREVKPGTLPAGEQVFSVPLKEITGAGQPAAGAAAPGESGAAPGAAGTQAAAPGGELPQTLPGAAPGTPGGMSYGTPPGLGEMVLIPEGYFLMGTGGAASAGDADELPQTQVYLPAYYIDKYPVSNRQFMEFVLRAGYKPEGKWQEYFAQGSADLPVRGVSWNDAAAYAEWAGKRLPTEAEWEKAARGTDGRTYPWGEDWSTDILPRGALTYELFTSEKAASPYGVMAMCGALWQWTASAYAAYPFNPDARGDKRVLRGGCFSNGHNIVRCANRYAEPPNVMLNTFAFRCAKDAK